VPLHRLVREQLAEQPIHVYVALSAFAGRQIEFEVEYAPAWLDTLQRSGGERRAAKIRVEDHAVALMSGSNE